MKRTLSLLALAGISMSHFLWSQSPGDLDPSFSTNGWLIDGAALNTDLTAVEVMADGRIVAAGVYDFGVNHNIWVCRWRPDGTLDPGFDGDGFAVLPGYFVESDEVDLALQANGKVVVAAWLSDFNSDYSALIRFDSTGALDANFGQGGLVLEPTSAVAEGFRQVNVQTSGRILAASHGSGALSVTAFDDNGDRDSNFGPFNGQVVIPFQTADEIYLRESAIGGNDDLTLLAYGNSAGMKEVHLIRVDADGDLVSNFGTAGIATVADTFYTEPQGLAVNDIGESFVMGTPSAWTGNLPVAVYKYNPTGALDNAWGVAGSATLQGGGHMHGWALLVAQDGKVYVGGEYDSGPTDIMVSRLTQGGQPDPTFGNNGIATDLTASGMIWANAIAEQPDGKVVVAGVQNNISDIHAFVARFLVSPATAFDPAGLDAASISIHPNPCSDLARLGLNLDQDVVVSIEVRDLAGRICIPVLSSSSLTAGITEFQLNLATLPAGMYHVVVHADARTLSQRLVIAH